MSVNRVGFASCLREAAHIPPSFAVEEPLQQHVFRRLLKDLESLNPRQIEDARSKIRDVRRRTEALAEIEARTERERNCSFCGHHKRQKWGRTKTGIQRFRCSNCRKTQTGRTGSTIARVHRPDLFLDLVRDMFANGAPSSIRTVAKRLGLNKHTIWRWRMMIISALKGAAADAFSGIVEVDEVFQRESRKGSREWVRHQRNPGAWPVPPRLRWYEYGHSGIPMMRGLSRWQLPILTIADRSGARRAERIPNRRDATIMQALSPLVAMDAALCSDKLNGYIRFAASRQMEHFIVGSKPGTRIASPSHHIQTINSLHSRYRRFIRPFCGPASKYLQGYVQWFIARDIRITAISAFQRL